MESITTAGVFLLFNGKACLKIPLDSRKYQFHPIFCPAQKQVEYIVQHIKQWYGITIQKKEILYFFLGETEYYYPGILKELDDLFALYIRKNVSTCTQKEIAEFKKWKNLMLLRRIKETAFMQFKSKDYTKMVYTIMKGKRYFYLLPFIAFKKLNYFSI